MPSRGVAARHAVTSTTVSPDRTMTEPSACLASLPVSSVIVRAPIWVWRFCKLTLCIRVSGGLLADAETADQFRVPFRILALEVIEQSPPLADKLQQAAARVMVLCVNLEMLGEIVDALAEERHLYFRRSCIAVVCPVGSDNPG